jgi:hypothetical protein
LTAASTAGVKTTAVASLESNAVTPTPTPKTMPKSATTDPFAARTARAATYSKRPARRASSESNIIPTRKK